MFRALTIIAAIAALAVSAAPASAGKPSKKPPPRLGTLGSTEVRELLGRAPKGTVRRRRGSAGRCTWKTSRWASTSTTTCPARIDTGVLDDCPAAAFRSGRVQIYSTRRKS